MDSTTISDSTPQDRPSEAHAAECAPEPTALDALVEAAMLACGASSGSVCINDRGQVRLVAVNGDAARVAAVAQDRCFPMRGDSGSALTVWRAVALPASADARFHVLARNERGAGEWSAAILVVDASREPADDGRRLLELLARQVPPRPGSPQADDLPALESRVAEARAEEGRRVTAELHAMLGHELSSAALALNAALPGIGGPAVCVEAVRAVAGLLQGAVGRCRERLAAGYGIDAAQEGFAPALRRLSAAVARRGGVKVHVHVAAGVSAQLTASSAYHLHHMAIDAIVGAVRHTRAATVVVSIATDSNAIVLRVDEDGSAVAGCARQDARRIDSIAAVAHMLGGEVRVRPRRPSGSSIRVRLPRAAGDGVTREPVQWPESFGIGRAASARRRAS